MEVSKTIGFFMATFLATAVMCSTQHNHLEWRKHNARVVDFECRTPQPRSVDARELFDEELFNSARSILPASTVLHRCGAAGCCSANKTCKPVKTEEVELVFLVLEGPKRKKYVEVKATNHTSCACEHHDNNPK